jgi:hypothetical protein
VTPKARAFSYLGAFSAVSALLAGCTPADGTIPAPPPATPASASATPPETAQQREERLAYEAAEKAYRTFRVEYDRISRKRGGSPKPTKAMIDNAAGPYLKTMKGFLNYKKTYRHHEDRPVRIAYVKHGGYSPDELILLVCEDGSKVKVFDDEDRQVSHGGTSKLSLRLRPVDHRWKIWDGDQTIVKTCSD